MKNAKSILILFTVLVAFGLAYFLMNNVKKPVTNDNANIEDSSIVIFQMNKEDISDVSIINQADTIVCYKNKDKYTIKGLEEQPILNTKVEFVFDAFANLKVDKLIEENPKDLKVFGLLTPEATITVKNKNGEIASFYVGNKVPSGSGRYFADTLKTKVYVLGDLYADTLLAAKNTYFDNVVYNLNGYTISEIDVKEKLLTMRLLTDAEKQQIDSYNKYEITRPFKKIADDTQVEKIMQNFITIEAVQVLGADKKEYGFDKPKYTITIKTVETKDTPQKTIVIMLGNVASDGTIYLKHANTVYKVNPSMFDFINQDPFMLLSPIAYIRSVQNIKQMTVKTLKSIATIDVTKQGESNQYKINSKDAPSDAFQTCYQSIIGVYVTGVFNEKPKSTPIFEFSILLNNGKTDLVRYIPYDERRIAVQVNGVTQFYTTKPELQKAIDAVDSFLVSYQ